MRELYTEILFPIAVHPNMFSIEGIDGSGKSTQAKNVVDTLRRDGIDTLYLTNPSSSDLGKFLRQHLRTLPPWQRFSLFVIDMLDVLDRNRHGDVLIWDRYIDSTITSNTDTEPDQAKKWVRHLPSPHHTYFLDIEPSTVLNSRQNSLHDHSLDLPWQTLKSRRYHELYALEPQRVTVINANLPQIDITTLITRSIKSFL